MIASACFSIAAVFCTVTACPVAGAGALRAPSTPPSRWDDPTVDFGVGDLIYPEPILVNRTAPRTVELLGDAMKGAHGPRRVSLLAEIGRCKLPQSVRYVREALTDSDPLFRREGIRSAGVMGDATLRDEVAVLLSDPDPVVQLEALVAVHAIDSARDASSGSPAVSVALANPATPKQVMLAALRRAASADAAAVAALLPQLPASLQPEASRALGRLKAAAHADAVIPLSRGDPAQRAAAVIALREMGAAQHLDAIAALLDDAHPTVRREALVGFGRLAPTAECQARGRSGMEDPDPSVRTAAADVLARHPTINAVPVLLRHLTDPLPVLHDAAREALANPASAEMRDLVSDRAADLLNDADRLRRIDGSFLLGRLRSDKNAARHLSFLVIKEVPAENDVPLMAQAAASVGQIGIKDAGPLLALMAQRVKASTHDRDPKKFLSNEAAVATFVSGAKLAEPGILPEARRMLAVGVEGGQDYQVRAAAVFALAWIAEPTDSAANTTLLKVARTEGGAPAVEAIKALLRRKVPGTLEVLRVTATSSFDPAARFVAHQAVERLTGVRQTYIPPTRNWEAATSIFDIAGEE